MQAIKDLWQGFGETCPWSLFLLLLIASPPVALAGHVGAGVVMLLVAEFGLLWDNR